ncbi:hypothetical protein [Nannocystis sp. SCPEA4]|uniref:hypothetical protein n=1 Tax=Nannocystis sp. SCPEA4 TaxID=2996787 RepID=UPI00226E8051|nr:hypothetical protein [Nannocystis sp. SCPEA4]MCY1057616.1 hypothetical protein [Nannocystis sp. SCPEA4]
MSERNRGGGWLVAGLAWCLWATACAEPEDWELTEIGTDEQAELLVDEDEEDEGDEDSALAAHEDADGSLDGGCTGGTLPGFKPSLGRDLGICADRRDMLK